MVDKVYNNNCKEWSKEQIVELIKNRDHAVERAIVRIYENQTNDEKVNSVTISKNNLGFNAIDAKYGTYLAKFILNGNKLTGIHLIKARKLILKYARQLTDIANSKR